MMSQRGGYPISLLANGLTHAEMSGGRIHLDLVLGAYIMGAERRVDRAEAVSNVKLFSSMIGGMNILIWK